VSSGKKHLRDAPLQPDDIGELDFDKGGGLLTAVIQNTDDGAILMVGYMNREALRETFTRRRVVFYSRSRRRLWEKGETSGNFLDVVEIRTDCDHDTLLVTARPRGPACHLGTATCFGDEPLFGAPQPPAQAKLADSHPLAFLSALEEVIERRIADRPEGSYTARLLSQGPTRIAQKVGEEGLEVALAAVAETDAKLLAESADLVYHLLVLLKSRGLPLERVVVELQSRHAGKP
jgi:phosphoribosyl-AMP cyclohydrolase / phosphoribosyl-ATP pyrophosphohydrolase